MNIEKIKSRVLVSSSGCWIWKNSCNSAGYGQLTENKKYWLAHRYSYVCIHRDIDSALVVRHSCHNPKCCNPEHLTVGTHKENYHDSAEAHRKAHERKSKDWVIAGKHYRNVRIASRETGISQGTLCKYSCEGIFDVEKYRAGCPIARVNPKL